VTQARPQAEREFTVYFFDTDAGGVVHNLAYLRWIEAVRTDLAEKLGWGIGEMIGGIHGCPVLTKTEADLSPGKFGDRIIVRGGVTEVGRVRFWVEFEVVRADDGTVLTKSRQSLALIRMPGAKAERLPAEWFK